MIAVGGENLIDLVAEAQTGNDGAHTGANSGARYLPIPGGGPFNVAMAAGRQGQNVTYLTPISSDAFGGLLAHCLDDAAVTIAAPRVSQPTSLAVVSLGANGTPSYSFHRNDTAERQVTLDRLASWMPAATKIFHVGGLALIDGADADAWEHQFLNCKAKKILTSLDPNVRPALITERAPYGARIRRMMQAADVLKLSDEDLLWLYPDRPLEQALADCRADCGAALFVLTLGADGARGFVNDLAVHVPSTPVKTMVDTVGAGDTFMASLLGWASTTGRDSRTALEQTDEASLTAALSHAAKAAALNCGRSGCNPPWSHEL